jgi:salicylate synthase
MSELVEQVPGAIGGPLAAPRIEGYLVASRDCEIDAVEAGARLVAGLPGPYLVYERQGQVNVGIGAAAELVMTRHEIRFRAGDAGWRTVPLGEEPLQRINDLLNGCGIADWRAYGWVAFELSFVLHGMPESAGDATLAHLIVPRSEARLDSHYAELRALTDAELADLYEKVGALAGLVAADQGDQAPFTEVDDMVGYDNYRHNVEAAVRDIRSQRLQKVILSRTVPVSGSIDLTDTYLAGRKGNTPARSFLLDVGGLQAAGFSPETVVEVDADARVSTQPLAGTRALTGEKALDDSLRAELLSDPKEIFEHAVSVHGAQEELRGICQDSSVSVEEFMGVSRRGSVQHLASRVSGHLSQSRNSWHALAALFPAVTASGLPKPEACDAIHRYESQPRDLYGGAVVMADADGSLDAALVLRTVFRRDDQTWLRAGAGVVVQSDPEREFEETREKLRSISQFLVSDTVPVEEEEQQ